MRRMRWTTARESKTNTNAFLLTYQPAPSALRTESGEKVNGVVL